MFKVSLLALLGGTVALVPFVAEVPGVSTPAQKSLFQLWQRSGCSDGGYGSPVHPHVAEYYTNETTNARFDFETISNKAAMGEDTFGLACWGELTMGETLGVGECNQRVNTERRKFDREAESLWPWRTSRSQIGRLHRKTHRRGWHLS